jgi:hypothetical protein
VVVSTRSWRGRGSVGGMRGCICGALLPSVAEAYRDKKQPPVAKVGDRRRMRSHKVPNGAYDPQLLPPHQDVYLAQIVAVIVFQAEALKLNTANQAA